MTHTFTFTNAELNTLQLAVANLLAEASAVAAEDSDFSELPVITEALQNKLEV